MFFNPIDFNRVIFVPVIESKKKIIIRKVFRMKSCLKTRYVAFITFIASSHVHSGDLKNFFAFLIGSHNI